TFVAASGLGDAAGWCEVDPAPLQHVRHGEISREAIDAMLAFAIRAAAVTCSRVGPNLPFAHEL
ncbi:hypothetical protein ACV34F_29860, partial [Pseudomonas aeruginosa]